MIKFAIKTLGCKVNQYESQVIRENLQKNGYFETDVESADLVIVNSCTVTSRADGKTRGFIRKFNKINPQAKIVVTGCSAVYPEDIKTLESISGVYKVVPNRDKLDIPFILKSIYGMRCGIKSISEEVSGFDSHTRAFVKIQDGCDQNCSYCKVSLVRGASRSREEPKAFEEIIRLAEKGYREMVLTGICLGSWKGEGDRNLSDLLERVDALPGDFRIRLSSIEPNHIGPALIDIVARSAKICRHFHIPLQSGSDRVLSLMKRRYNTAKFRELVADIRSKIPLAGITMDIIAGFPGETEKDIEHTAGFIEEIQPSRLHVFKYSDRKNTASYDMTPKIDPVVAKKRVEHLIAIGTCLQEKFCKKFIGKEVEVLIEEKTAGGSFTGYTREYVQVKVPGSIGSPAGSLVRVKPTGIDPESRIALLG